MSNKPRVRFAPSPTGPLHIGGVRTALYNYLYAKKTGGTFILRIEDTDQGRYVKGAEDYIIEALNWAGISPQEGVSFGGDLGPYRQSDRKDLYKKYAMQLVETGHAYYAFDTSEELTALRERLEKSGGSNRNYNAATRGAMKNSFTLTKDEVKAKLDSGEPFVIRFRVPENETVKFTDIVRGDVQFDTNNMDDKVMFKSDGMPTYHLANIVDDHSMKITHVIRGEEWLASTPLHVLLYRAFGWEDTMPQFAHLPLILKPEGKGKLSKRDGAKFDMPVFPLYWNNEATDEVYDGFRERGFLPHAMINFLAFLGWNPGTEQEIFTIDELANAFDLNEIVKSGARFDYKKALWFNQQYQMNTPDDQLAKMIRPIIEKKGHEATDEFLSRFAGLYKERAMTLSEFWEQGYYFFTEVKSYDEKILRKKWKPEKRAMFDGFLDMLKSQENFTANPLETNIKAYMESKDLKFGEVFPILRIALSGTTKGPSVFEMMELMGKDKVTNRMQAAYEKFDAMKSENV